MEEQIPNSIKTIKYKDIDGVEQDMVNDEEFQKVQTYSREKKQFAMLRTWVMTLFNLTMWTMNWPAKIWNYFQPQIMADKHFKGQDYANTYVNDLYLALTLIMVMTLIEMVVVTPFSLYFIFGIEQTHGFNK